MIKHCAVSLTFLLGCNLLVSGQTYGRQSLRGIQGVKVEIVINDTARKIGLSKDQLRTDVELKLRKAGIKVLTENEKLNVPGKPYLVLNLAALETGKKRDTFGYAYFIELRLFQDTKLLKDVEVVSTTASGTWHTAGLLAVVPLTAGLFQGEVRGNLADLTDKFINDYLAVNPK